MKRILFSIAALTLIFINTKAKAQQTETSDIAVSIATVTEFTATSVNLAPFNFTTGAQLASGIEQTNAVNLAYKANKLTTISIKALGTHFSSPTAGNSHMPVSVIQWKKSSGGTYASLSNTDVNVATSQAKGSADVVLDYKITPTLAYDPASDYSVTIQYTLTAQ